MKRSFQIAQEISNLLPVFLRHMYPYIFGKMEIPPSQVLAITIVHEKKICHLSELSREMQISAPTITGIIDRLEKTGYVKRLLDKNDRRAVNIILTKRGIGVVRRFRLNIMNRWETILTKVPTQDQESLIGLMKKITKGFINGSIP